MVAFALGPCEKQFCQFVLQPVLFLLFLFQSICQAGYIVLYQSELTPELRPLEDVILHVQQLHSHFSGIYFMLWTPFLKYEEPGYVSDPMGLCLF